MRTTVTRSIIECDVCHLVLNDVSEVAIALPSMNAGDAAHIAKLGDRSVMMGTGWNSMPAELCPRCALTFVQDMISEFQRREHLIMSTYPKWFKEPVVRGIHIPGIAGLEHP